MSITGASVTAPDKLSNALLLEVSLALHRAAAGTAARHDLAILADRFGAALAARAASATAGGARGGLAGKGVTRSGRPGKWFMVSSPTGESFWIQGIPAVAKLVGRSGPAITAGLARGQGHWEGKGEPDWAVREATGLEVAKIEERKPTEEEKAEARARPAPKGKNQTIVISKQWLRNEAARKAREEAGTKDA